MQALGSYRLGYVSDSLSVSFRNVLVGEMTRTPAQRIGIFRYYNTEARPDSTIVLKDAAFVDSIAQLLAQPRPALIDVFFTDARPPLHELGITAITEPFEEMTIGLGPIVVAKKNAQGAIDRHELVHAVQGARRLHPFISEGQAAMWGGLGGRSLAESVCDNLSLFNQLSQSDVSDFVSGRGKLPAELTDLQRTALAGILAAAVESSPPLWEPFAIPAVADKVAILWHRRLQDALKKCTTRPDSLDTR
ncbi:MAG: hypothetical protein ACO1Q7_02565 [Gemmatimonas sp.]